MQDRNEKQPEPTRHSDHTRSYPPRSQPHSHSLGRRRKPTERRMHILCPPKGSATRRLLCHIQSARLQGRTIGLHDRIAHEGSERAHALRKLLLAHSTKSEE